MRAKKATISIIAFLGIFVFLAVAPVGAKDPMDMSKGKASMTQAADTAKATSEAATTEKININKADLAALAQIKGIGPETAQNIISYRKEVGSFGTLEDLMKVKGIGENTLEQIKPFVSLR